MATYSSRVSVKFHDSVSLPYNDDIGSNIDGLTADGWKRLELQFPGVRIRRTFQVMAQDELVRLVKRVADRNPAYRPPNFLTLFIVDCRSESVVESVAEEIRTWAIVEFAVPIEQASAPTGGSSGLNALQGYEDEAPKGVDARCAWTIDGGDGRGQAMIDIELGWTLDHDDFTVHNPQLLFGTAEELSRSHGTSVLGVICAANNQSGLTGIARGVASINCMSYSNGSGGDVALIPGAIDQAVQQLDAGNVLLLEVELGFKPCETDPQCLIAIELATAAHIVVVEAAGNGGQDLDNWTNAWGEQQLRRSLAGARVRDSKAIIVSGALPLVPHLREPLSNFGSGIDCYAWGTSVLSSCSVSAGDLSSHTIVPEFWGTSAASAIIAGVCLSVQGMFQAKTGGRMQPLTLRQTLTTIGTHSPDQIGVMPDLCKIGRAIQQMAAPPQPPTNVHINP